MKRIVMAAVTAVGLMAASTAQAVPYTDGSFSFSAFTSTTTDVTTTTSFVLTPASLAVGIGTDDFALVVLPATLAQVSPLDFTLLTPGALDWSDAGLGSFDATSAVLVDSAGGLNAFATWNVVGTFTVGADFDNAGAILSANETWSLTQTGGPDNAISLSGTFHSPAVVTPEPATLTLLGVGVGLAGLLAMRRRRKTVV